MGVQRVKDWDLSHMNKILVLYTVYYNHHYKTRPTCSCSLMVLLAHDHVFWHMTTFSGTSPPSAVAKQNWNSCNCVQGIKKTNRLTCKSTAPLIYSCSKAVFNITGLFVLTVHIHVWKWHGIKRWVACVQGQQQCNLCGSHIVNTDVTAVLADVEIIRWYVNSDLTVQTAVLTARHQIWIRSKVARIWC